MPKISAPSSILSPVAQSYRMTSINTSSRQPTIHQIPSDALIEHQHNQPFSHPQLSNSSRFDQYTQISLHDIIPQPRSSAISRFSSQAPSNQLRTDVGIPLKNLAQTQLEYISERASAEGISSGEWVKKQTEANGYGNKKSQWWNFLSKGKKESWEDRFATVVAEIKASAPDDILRLIRKAEKKGGGIRWRPERTEELGAFAYNSGVVLGVGRSWLEAAEGNITSIYANIAHELGGHLEYDRNFSQEIINGALHLMSRSERSIAESGDKSIFSAFAYMETELYAELREVAHLNQYSQGDNPFFDVRRQMMKIKTMFAPMAANAIIFSLAQYIKRDEYVTDEARKLFHAQAFSVFGLDFT